MILLPHLPPPSLLLVGVEVAGAAGGVEVGGVETEVALLAGAVGDQALQQARAADAVLVANRHRRELQLQPDGDILH